jgi:small nuclear ribonucleoprotein E
MNLVIDDAVEVKQSTKDKPESRRQLGMFVLKLRGMV